MAIVTDKDFQGFLKLEAGVDLSKTQLPAGSAIKAQDFGLLNSVLNNRMLLKVGHASAGSDAYQQPVVELQRELVTWLSQKGNEELAKQYLGKLQIGTYDENMKNLVTEFQNRYGLSKDKAELIKKGDAGVTDDNLLVADGVVGPRTARALRLAIGESNLGDVDFAKFSSAKITGGKWQRNEGQEAADGAPPKADDAGALPGKGDGSTPPAAGPQVPPPAGKTGSEINQGTDDLITPKSYSTLGDLTVKQVDGKVFIWTVGDETPLGSALKTLTHESVSPSQKLRILSVNGVRVESKVHLDALVQGADPKKEITIEIEKDGNVIPNPIKIKPLRQKTHNTFGITYETYSFAFGLQNVFGNVRTGAILMGTPQDIIYSQGSPQLEKDDVIQAMLPPNAANDSGWIEIKNSADLHRALTNRKSGQEIAFRVKRGDDYIVVKVSGHQVAAGSSDQEYYFGSDRFSD